MKKKYILIGMILVSFLASAQNDIKVEFLNVTEGLTYSGSVDLAFRITPKGSTIIQANTGIYSSLIVDQKDNYGLNSFPSNSTMISPVSVPTPLSSRNFADFNSTFPVYSTPSGNLIEVCIAVYGTDQSLINLQAKPFTTTWDTDFTDNVVCIMYDPMIATGVEESSVLTEVAKRIYFANDQIIIGGVDYVFSEEANIVVIDISGRTVVATSMNLNESNMISLADQSNGIYFVKLVLGNDVVTAKVLRK